jgi:hypothetical protein
MNAAEQAVRKITESPSSDNCPASQLSPDQRKDLAIQMITGNESVTELSKQNGVSRKFLYKQAEKAHEAIDLAFCEKEDEGEEKVLFHIPVTKSWLRQVVLALVLICHSSYRGVAQFFRSILDTSVSVGTVHNIVKEVVPKARQINDSQDLSPVKVGANDEIFQGGMPVLAGVDVASTYCYLLACEKHRDAETWGIHLLDLAEQGLKPDYIVADAGKGLRAGQALAWPGVPCFGDVFHALSDFRKLGTFLDNRAYGAIKALESVEKQMIRAKKHSQGNKLSKKLGNAKENEEKYVSLAQDVSALFDWLRSDILSLSGQELPARRELFDFVVGELRKLEPLCAHRIGPVRRSLENQRDDLLGFVTVLDDKLMEISRQSDVPLRLVRAVCELQGMDESSQTRWEREARVREQLKGQFYKVEQAVVQAMNETPRASSMIENFNGRLRNYFFLRRTLGSHYLDLLRFFLNHRTFMRSERAERVGKSPAELLTGQKHSHWLELLGFTLFRRQTA